ncbi:DUF2971 domain-containing protein [Sinorhizobium fredii]
MTVEPHPHLPPSLYKYCSQNAARAILGNKTLQFSRPGLFNDGFDLRIELAINIDEKAVVERALDQIYEGAYGPKPFPVGNTLGALLLLMRFFPGKPEPDAFKEAMRPCIEELVANRKTMLRQLCDELATETAKFKVLCLSSSGTIAPMWGNYAENICGAALQFAPREEDSLFLTARPVTYVDHEPVLFDDQGFIDWLSGRRGLDDSDLFSQFLYTKTADWASEREWRIVAGYGWQPQEDREYVEFSARDLEAVVFGFRANAEFREEIATLVTERYPECRLREMRRVAGEMAYEIVDL